MNTLMCLVDHHRNILWRTIAKNLALHSNTMVEYLIERLRKFRTDEMKRLFEFC